MATYKTYYTWNDPYVILLHLVFIIVNIALSVIYILNLPSPSPTFLVNIQFFVCQYDKAE